LDLSGIDWVIVGGGSDILAKIFEVEWALNLRRECEERGIAFFLKQLGRRPIFDRNPLFLANGHGQNTLAMQCALISCRQLPRPSSPCPAANTQRFGHCPRLRVNLRLQDLCVLTNRSHLMECGVGTFLSMVGVSVREKVRLQ